MSGVPHDVIEDIKMFLQAEAKHRYSKDMDMKKFENFLVSVSIIIELGKVSHELCKVPQQQNLIDCGIWTLHFMKMFVNQPQFFSNLIEVCISWNMCRYSFSSPNL